MRRQRLLIRLQMLLIRPLRLHPMRLMPLKLLPMTRRMLRLTPWMLPLMLLPTPLQMQPTIWQMLSKTRPRKKNLSNGFDSFGNDRAAPFGAARLIRAQNFE